MNHKLGFYSSVVVGLSTIAFAFSMLIGNTDMSYGSSMFISWAYILYHVPMLPNQPRTERLLP